MEDFGDNYRDAWSNLLTALTVERNTFAIDGLGDVVAELRSHLPSSQLTTSTKDTSRDES